MPRVSKGPVYEPTKRRWVWNYQGEKIRLVVDCDKNRETEKEAWERYDEERALRANEREADKGPVWVVLNRYLEWCKNREDPPPVAPNSLALKQRVIQPFINQFGNVLTRDVRPHHFDEFLTKMKQPRANKRGLVRSWNAGTCRVAMATFRAAFGWASTIGGLTKSNPFNLPGAEKVKAKRVRYKGKRLPISDDEHRAMLKLALAKTNKDFAYLLMLLYETGARPAEMLLATAAEWDEKNKAFVIKADDPNNVGRFKLARLGEDRTVYIPDHLVPLVRVLMEKHPTGTLFRTAKNKLFTLGTLQARILCCQRTLKRRHEREVIRKGISAYSYRHAYVTRWMERSGADVQHLAVLLGTSVTMLEKHYSHLFKMHDTLRESLNRFAAADRPATRDGTSSGGAPGPVAASPEAG